MNAKEIAAKYGHQVQQNDDVVSTEFGKNTDKAKSIVNEIKDKIERSRLNGIELYTKGELKPAHVKAAESNLRLLMSILPKLKLIN